MTAPDPATLSDAQLLEPEIARARLLAWREELTAMRESSGESRKTVELDQQSVGRLSRMDALQGQAMAQETERRRIRDLQRIDAALNRLEQGEYGACVKCGEDIAPKRLRIDPAAAACIACAS